MQKNIIWGGLAGGVTFFILGFLFYGFLLKSYFAANTMTGVYKEMPDFPILVMGNIIMGFLYAIVVGSWSNPASVGDGTKKAFIVALLLTVGYDLIMYSTSNIMINMNCMLVDMAVGCIMGTIVGAVVVLVMGTSKKA